MRPASRRQGIGKLTATERGPRGACQAIRVTKGCAVSFFDIELRAPRVIDVPAVDVERNRDRVGLVPHLVDRARRHRQHLARQEHLGADLLELRVTRARPVVLPPPERVPLGSQDARDDRPRPWSCGGVPRSGSQLEREHGERVVLFLAQAERGCSPAPGPARTCGRRATGRSDSAARSASGRTAASRRCSSALSARMRLKSAASCANRIAIQGHGHLQRLRWRLARSQRRSPRPDSLQARLPQEIVAIARGDPDVHRRAAARQRQRNLGARGAHAARSRERGRRGSRRAPHRRRRRDRPRARRRARPDRRSQAR